MGMMTKMIKKIPLPETKEEWKENRLSGIGGSDAAAALGMSPYKSKYYLWCEKTKRIEKDIDNEAMRVGRDLEEYVARRFCEETGKKVRKSNYSYQSVEYPYMLANVDRFVVGEDAGLECKTASALNRTRYDKGDIPIQYYLQCMHYMAVTGLKKWYLAVLVMGKEFHIFEINRDDQEIEILIEQEKEFWDCVVNDEEPLIDGSDSSKDALDELYPKAKEKEVLTLDEDENIERYFELKELEKKIKNEMKEIENNLKNLMNEYEYAVSSDYRISWKNSSTTRIDSDFFKNEYADIYNECLTTTSSRRFQIKKG